MTIQFTLQELFNFLAYVVGISVGIFLLIILWNINKILGTLRTIIVSNQKEIEDTITTLPGIFENTEQITSNVKETTDRLKVSVPAIVEDVEGVSKVTREKIEFAGVVIENVGSGINDVVDVFKKETSEYAAYYNVLKEVFQIIYRTFSSRKK